MPRIQQPRGSRRDHGRTRMARQTRERRRVARRDYQAPLFFRPSALRDANAVDISEIGITFITEQEVAVDTDVELFLVNKNVQINGTVRHCEPYNGGRLRVGVAFLKPEPELVEVLTLAWERRHEE